jgi:hypothetical protein
MLQLLEIKCTEELTAATLSYAQAGASYVTLRQGQGSLNRGNSIVWKKYQCLEIVILVKLTFQSV